MEMQVGGIHGVGAGRPERPIGIQCKECKCMWFEPVRLTRLKEFPVVLGQASPELDGVAFYFYRCIRCNHLNEVPTVYTGIDSIRKIYEDCLGAVNDANKERRSCCKGKSQ